MAEFKLTQAQRSQIFNGRHARLTFPGDKPCPVAPGFTYALSSNVRIEVIEVHQRGSKRRFWDVLYVIRDDRPQYVRRLPPVHDPIREARRGAPTAEEIRSAGRESAITSSEADAITDAGEVVDEISQRRYTRDAELKAEQADVLARARRERYDLARRIERLEEAADRLGVDVSSPMRVIERQLAQAEKRVFEGKAA